MQEQYLQALRSRENEVLQFLAVFMGGLGGYGWVLFNSYNNSRLDPLTFSVIVLGTLLILHVGALYTLALAYNYRSIVLQLRKLEKTLGIESYVLEKWRKSVSYVKSSPCTPVKIPEVLSPFFWGYVVGILLVGTTSICRYFFYSPFGGLQPALTLIVWSMGATLLGAPVISVIHLLYKRAQYGSLIRELFESSEN